MPHEPPEHPKGELAEQVDALTRRIREEHPATLASAEAFGDIRHAPEWLAEVQKFWEHYAIEGAIWENLPPHTRLTISDKLLDKESFVQTQAELRHHRKSTLHSLRDSFHLDTDRLSDADYGDYPGADPALLKRYTALRQHHITEHKRISALYPTIDHLDKEHIHEIAGQQDVPLSTAEHDQLVCYLSALTHAAEEEPTGSLLSRLFGTRKTDLRAANWGEYTRDQINNRSSDKSYLKRD